MDMNEHVEQLQAALKAERERRTAAERRAELLEETARRAYRFAVWRPERQAPGSQTATASS